MTAELYGRYRLRIMRWMRWSAQHLLSQQAKLSKLEVKSVVVMDDREYSAIDQTVVDSYSNQNESRHVLAEVRTNMIRRMVCNDRRPTPPPMLRTGQRLRRMIILDERITTDKDKESKRRGAAARKRRLRICRRQHVTRKTRKCHD